MNVTLLRQQIKEMREDIINGRELDDEKLKVKYEYLFSKTPSLWYMIKDNEENYMDLLNILLDKAEAFHGEKEENQEAVLEKEHHSVNELLAEKYVYPVVGKKPE